MIKKIYLIFFVTLLLASCGKKSDPIYKAKNNEIFNTEIKMVL